MKVVVVKIDIADETLTIEQLHKLIGEAVEKGAKRIEVPEERKGIPYEVSFVRDATDEEESKNVFNAYT